MDILSLSHIDEELDSFEVAALCFLCQDVLNRKRLENVREGRELFLRLREKDLLKNSHFLSQLLITIRREDLLSYLETDSRQPEQESNPQTDASPALSPYRTLLYQVSEDVTQENLNKMKFLLSNKLAKGRLDLCTTALDVLAEMERQNHLSEQTLEVLEETLMECDAQLALKIKQYRTGGFLLRETVPHINQRGNNLQIPVRPSVTVTQPSSEDGERLFTDSDPVSPSDSIGYYPMTHNPRGWCLIINNEHFETNELTNRPGTEKDKSAIASVFSRLGFKVKVFDNLTAAKMLKEVEDLGKKNHFDADALVVCVLSHGEIGCVFGVDGKRVPLRSLTFPFTSGECRSLAGKPKLFFIQACQGTGYQRGMSPAVSPEQTEGRGTFESDAGPVQSIATDADFLIGMATVDECKSFRNTKEGSIYIQELCRQLERAGPSGENILTVLTCVNNEVSRGEYLRYKQMPEPKYTLTKNLVLPFI
ncbi:caspase-8 [Osmerus eperlanus]|uniref:caspase-8 n=1 Tax=Osmerus eperlanus TaxID=29151 RepID=UPI002E110982